MGNTQKSILTLQAWDQEVDQDHETSTYKYMPLSYCSCSCLPVGGTMAGWGIPVGCMPDGPSIRG